jgi:hypothetical protein
MLDYVFSAVNHEMILLHTAQTYKHTHTHCTSERGDKHTLTHTVNLSAETVLVAEE